MKTKVIFITKVNRVKPIELFEEIYLPVYTKTIAGKGYTFTGKSMRVLAGELNILKILPKKMVEVEVTIPYFLPPERLD